MTRPIFYCHVPKTAGTTVRLALEKQFAPHEIVPDTGAMNQNDGQYSSIAAVEMAMRAPNKEVKLLRGHYHYSIRRWLESAINIVVLREPIARSLSEIRHHIAYGNLDVAKAYSAFENGHMPIPDNVMTRYLGDTLFNGRNEPIEQRHERLLRNPISDANEALRSAMNAVDSVDVLGLTENIAAFAAALERQTGVVLGEGRHNVSPCVDLSLTDGQLAVIRESNKLDIELYKYAQSALQRDRAVGTKC